MKQRIDSATSKLRILESASKPVNPPRRFKLTASERVEFRALIAKRARALWTESDIARCAHLARLYAEINRQSLLIAEEGFMIVDPNTGYLVENPRRAPVDRLERAALALGRHIGLQSGAESRNAAARDQKEKLARDIERASQSSAKAQKTLKYLDGYRR